MRRITLGILPLFAIVGAAYAQDSVSSSSKAKQKTEQHVTRRAIPPAASVETTYHDSEFAFTYKIPYGWVDRTKAMQDESADTTKSKLLLAVFERPPEVTGDTVNSALVITAENAASYPGLKSAADYLGPLTELTTSKGFKSAADPSELSIGSTSLVRADFEKQIGKLSMRQSSLIVLRKGFVVLFTFIAGSEDELDELIERLSFGASKP